MYLFDRNRAKVLVPWPGAHTRRKELGIGNHVGGAEDSPASRLGDVMPSIFVNRIRSQASHIVFRANARIGSCSEDNWVDIAKRTQLQRCTDEQKTDVDRGSFLIVLGPLEHSVSNESKEPCILRP